MLIDTDVLIWLFRGRESARRALVGVDKVTLSAVTYMESWSRACGTRRSSGCCGARSTKRSWTVLPLDENIGHRAIVYVENYSLSHGIGLADALIAASAVESGAPLMTANAKRFKPIADVELVRYKP